MVTIAKEMALNQSMMHSIMRRYHSASHGRRVGAPLLRDGTRRCHGGVSGQLSRSWTVARASRLSALLLLPSVFGVSFIFRISLFVTNRAGASSDTVILFCNSVLISG
jgi:hypothetical protein